MNDTTRKNCELLIQNWRSVKNVFRWDTALINLSCAGVYTTKGLQVDEGKLSHCKDILKSQVGPFSNFKSMARNPLITMMAVSEDGEQTLKRGLEVYGLLKERFWTSTFLPIAAMIIAQMVQPYRYQEIVARTRQMYDKMKAEHPLLTSGEDSALCALLAMSDRSIDALVYDMNACYQLLKPNFFSSNAVQSLSQVLALGEGSPHNKCRKTLDLFNKLKDAGHKYGTNYELSTLGVLALTDVDINQVVAEIIEIDNWLSGQEGFGFFSSITKKQRLMYAGILAQAEHVPSDTLTTAAVNGTVALIVAQQAAMCAAIAASSAAASSASN
ncbi:MAG TPA: DUF4003 family protein [Lachnospiraceae bacterium]|nr:DUF4003 family protein [Lachnospiraceae bacterium]